MSLYEAITILIRYLLMVGVGVLTFKGYIDESMTEPLIAAGMAAVTVIWVGIQRLAPKVADVLDDPMDKVQDEQ